jgi:hypothetical protein
MAPMVFSAPPRGLAPVIALTVMAAFTSGCYSLRGSSGGAQTTYRSAERQLRPQDIAVPLGYRIEKVASGLTFPTAVVFDDRERLYVVEAGYSYGESWATPRLIRLEPDDRWTVVAAGEKNGPWNGAAFYKGNFFVSEGGQLEGGRILKIDSDGKILTLIEGLPSHGDHHTNGPAIGPDGFVYFGQGTMTNSGVVGEDNDRLGLGGFLTPMTSLAPTSRFRAPISRLTKARPALSCLSASPPRPGRRSQAAFHAMARSCGFPPRAELWSSWPGVFAIRSAWRSARRAGFS